MYQITEIVKLAGLEHPNREKLRTVVQFAFNHPKEINNYQRIYQIINLAEFSTNFSSTQTTQFVRTSVENTDLSPENTTISDVYYQVQLTKWLGDKIQNPAELREYLKKHRDGGRYLIQPSGEFSQVGLMRYTYFGTRLELEVIGVIKNSSDRIDWVHTQQSETGGYYPIDPQYLQRPEPKLESTHWALQLRTILQNTAQNSTRY